MALFFGSAPAMATETPVAAYSFDEGEGETAEDLTGDGHAATIEGASWSTNGRYGGAVGFDASEEDGVKIPHPTELDFSEKITPQARGRPNGGEPRRGPLVAPQQSGGKRDH